MFNPFGRGGQKQDSHQQRSKQNELANNLNNKLLAFMEIKSLENNLYNTCFKRCLKLDDQLFTDEEKECLTNCNSKIIQLFEISKQHFSNVENNIQVLQKGIKGQEMA